MQRSLNDLGLWVHGAMSCFGDYIFIRFAVFLVVLLYIFYCKCVRFFDGVKRYIFS